MARPGRPERNRAAQSFRQLRRFHHVINPDEVFGTHTVWRSCIARHPTNFAEENSRFLFDTLEVEGTAYLCRESPLPQLACARARGLSEVSAPAGHDGQQKASVGMPCAREGRPPLRQTKRKNKKRKWCIRRSVATTTRQRRDRLKGHPQERQHSAAEWRDAGPSAPGESTV
jgi:hypothetical protein